MAQPKNVLVFEFLDRNTGESYAGLSIKLPDDAHNILTQVRARKEQIAMDIGNLNLVESFVPVLIIDEPTEALRDVVE